MDNAIPTFPAPKNEPVLDYRPGAPETLALKAELTRQWSQEVEIPVIINGREIRTGQTDTVRAPHDHKHVLGTFHKAGPEEIRSAISGAMKAWADWSRWPAEARGAVFLKAAELLAGRWRPVLNAATMLGQSKTAYQAEIDSACELVDFLRFNVTFMERLYKEQPISAPGQWNRLEYRALEGFVFAVSPFNFTAIAGNLTSAPAMMGNVTVWKPASTAMLSGYYLMKLFEEAGLPPGVIQFLPGSGKQIGEIVFADRNFAGLHFTGSTAVFQDMWRTAGTNLGTYRTYPRLVGETGGKDFVLAHPSADPEALVTALVRGAFEYQGQKCSAASRAYIPKSLWPKVKERLVAEVKTITVGDVMDFRNFMGAVIDRASAENIRGYLDDAKRNAEIVVGGNVRDEVGWFVEPTIIETKDPKYRSICEEIFGPVLTVYVYDDARFDDTMKLVDETSPYALTGAVLAQDRAAVVKATAALTHSAGNFYINNKPTGAVVGQQPFGGARGSGTNDKAGSFLNLVRWTSVRTISETLVPPRQWRYPFMEGK